MIQLTLTLKMSTAQVVETSVTVNKNSPIPDYVHPGWSYSTYLWVLLYIALIFIGLIALLFTLSVIAVITAVYAGPHD